MKLFSWIESAGGVGRSVWDYISSVSLKLAYIEIWLFCYKFVNIIFRLTCSLRLSILEQFEYTEEIF